MNGIAVGIDLVDVERIERLIERAGDRMLNRLLTSDERTYCESQISPAIHIAARIAAKEAAYKAFSQCGCEGIIWWRDFEVVRDSQNRPTLHLHNGAETSATELKIASYLLSLTHTENQAAAIVVLLRS